MQTGIASVTFETQTKAETSLALYALDMAIDANDGNLGANRIAVELRKAQRAPRTQEGNLRITISAAALEQIAIGFEILADFQMDGAMDPLSDEEQDALVAILAHNKRVGAIREASKAGALEAGAWEGVG